MTTPSGFVIGWRDGLFAVAAVLLFFGTAIQPAVATPNLDIFPSGAKERAIPAPFRDLPDLVAELKTASFDKTDSDNDTLPDAVELVIGTDPENPDTDFDRVNDSMEIQHRLDPKKPDSNGDQLADWYELNNGSSDTDGDGTPNGWERDNDNDGVMDGLDTSPYSVSQISSTFDISVASSGKPTYLEIQMRPKNATHLRLFYQTWDWPWDNRSIMQDLDASKSDVVITPLIVLSMNQELDASALVDYGVMVENRTATLPLFPVFEYENIVAFKAKLFIPESPGSRSFTAKAKFLWRVTGYTDKAVVSIQGQNAKYIAVDSKGALTATSDTVTDSTKMEIIPQKGDRVVIKAANGKYVRVNPDNEFAIEATASVVDELCMFQLHKWSASRTGLWVWCADDYVTCAWNGTLSLAMGAAGFEETFYLADAGYRSEALVLATYPEDFYITGLSAQENFGSQAGMFYSGNSTRALNANLVMAYDFLRNASNNMSNMPAILTAKNVSMTSRLFSFSHMDAAAVATNGNYLKQALDSLPDGLNVPVINLMEHNLSTMSMDSLVKGSYIISGALALDLTKAPAVTTRVLKSNWYNTATNGLLGMPEVVAEQLKLGLSKESIQTLIGLELAWNTGEMKVVKIGTTPFKFDVPEIYVVNEVVDSIVLKGLDALGQVISVLQIAKAAYAFVQIMKLAPLANVAASESTFKLFSATYEAVSSVHTGLMGIVNTVGEVLNIIGFVVAVGMSIYMLVAIGNQLGWSPSGIALAVMTAMMSLVYSCILTAIGATGIVGAVILLLVGLSEFLCWLFGDFSWSQWLMDQFVNWIMDMCSRVRVRSTVDIEATDVLVSTADRDGNGLDVGDRINYTVIFNTTCIRTMWGDDRDRDDSFIRPYFALLLPSGIPTDNGLATRQVSSSIDYDRKYTDYNCTQFIEPSSPAINYPMNIIVATNYQYFLQDDFWMGKWYCERKCINETDVSPWDTMYFDVMPGTIDSFVDWTAITSNDFDGDGINNTDENLAARWTWDADGDGLSDKYERLTGTYPRVADTDQDGLSDYDEVLLGTSALNKDTDGDGLSDYAEVAGWTVNFNFSGQRFHWLVSPDPRCPDTDGDGLSDLLENGSLLNPVSADTNGNGVPDPDDYATTSIMYLGNFQGGTASWRNAAPFDIERAPDGTLYAAMYNTTSFSTTVFKYRADGALSAIWRSIANLQDIAVGPGGNVYELALLPSTVYVYSPDEVLLRSFPVCSTASAMAIDGNNGLIYAADLEFGLILKYNMTGTLLASWRVEGWAGQREWGKMCVDSNGNLYVADGTKDCIYKMNSAGTVLRKYSQTALGGFLDPMDVDVGADGKMLVLDTGNDRLVKLDVGGNSIGAFGTSGAGNGQFSYATGLAQAPGYIYVADNGNGRIQNLSHACGFVPPSETFSYTDTDSDGLPDLNETAGWNISVTMRNVRTTYKATADPLLPDTDGDGLTDLREHQIGTDPRKKDTDNDTIPDAQEAGAGGRAGPSTDATNSDTDADGLEDGIELTFGSDPTNNDTDGEGLNDSVEFDLGSCPTSADSDEDGLGDLAENDLRSCLTAPDSDGDSLFDGGENALGTSLFDNDTDSDGLPDAGELAYNTSPTDGDSDQDGLADGFEVDRGMDPRSNDTDGDGVQDAAEIGRGQNPRLSDSDGDGIPDSEDNDYLIQLVERIVLVNDTDDAADAVASGLAQCATVIRATPADLSEKYRSEPCIVLVGRPSAANGTAGALVREVLKDDGSGALEAMLASDLERMAVRYGVWSPTQTVIMLSRALPSDGDMITGIFKSLKMTVTSGSVTARYLNPRSSFLLDDATVTKATGSVLRVKLESSVPLNVSIARHNASTAPSALDYRNGLTAGYTAMGMYLDIDLSEHVQGAGVDLVKDAQLEVYYDEGDLDQNGDGDTTDPEDLNESTLALYCLDPATGNWSMLSKGLDQVNDTGIDAGDIVLNGKAYSGRLWADIGHLSLFGIAGRTNLLPVATVARAGDDVRINMGDMAVLNGTLSSGNGAILNHTWTLMYDNTTVVQYGPLFSFTFGIAGLYAVTLKVTDALGISASTTVNVTVVDAPWVLSVGPITNAKGRPVEGAAVRITLEGQSWTNTTDAAGIARFEMKLSAIGGNLTVNVTAKGYRPAEYTAKITPSKSLDAGPPVLATVPVKPAEPGFPTGMVAAVLLVVIVLAAVAVVAMRRKGPGRGKGEGEEKAHGDESPHPEQTEAEGQKKGAGEGKEGSGPAKDTATGTMEGVNQRPVTGGEGPRSGGSPAEAKEVGSAGGGDKPEAPAGEMRTVPPP